MRRYLQRMARLGNHASRIDAGWIEVRGIDLRTVVLVLALSASALFALALSVVAAGAQSTKTKPGGHSLLSSRELWATVDVCNPSDQPNTVGVRGSMPGDEHPKDTMYMRFQLQYLEAKTDTWTDLVHGGDSGFIGVGTAKSARQGGTSFQLMPVAGKPAYTIRGLVTFQWRHGASILHEATRTTSAGHQGVADADPAGYSAVQCTIA
jgi:hypothetical protein